MDKCRELFNRDLVKLQRLKYKSHTDLMCLIYQIAWNASHDSCHELCHSLLVQDKPIPVNDDKWNVGLTAAAIAIRKDKVKL